MNPERCFPVPEAEFTPASETEKDIPEKLRELHEVRGEFLASGVFFDVYGMELPDDKGHPEPFVFKDFRSGDVTMDPKEQVALFQHQYYEWNYLRERLGREFFPESYWIRSSEFSEDEAHGFYSVPGKTANTMQEFIKVQLDRQLAGRYSSDDHKKGAIEEVMGGIGGTLIPKHEEKRFIGAIIQQRVNGVTFAEALRGIDQSDEGSGRLRDSVRRLIGRLREYHNESKYTSFTWHGLDSDNVMAETDNKGKLTGRVYIIDANFTERPNKPFKEAVVKKLEKNVFEKLEAALDLGR